VALRPQGGRSGQGTVLASAARGEGVLVVEGLSGPAPGQVYQVWAVPAGSSPESAEPGRTWVSSAQPAVVHFDGLTFEDSTQFMVTLEPRGGSATPNLPPVLTSVTNGPTRST